MFQDDNRQSNGHDSQGEFDTPLCGSLGSNKIEEPSQCPERGLWFFPRYDDCSPPCSFLDNQDNVFVDMPEQSISLCHYEVPTWFHDL